MSLFLDPGKRVVFFNFSLFIYVTIQFGRGSIKGNLASVNKYVEFFYTFPNIHMITSSYNSNMTDWCLHQIHLLPIILHFFPCLAEL